MRKHIFRRPETFAKKSFPRQPKPKHRFSAVFVSNIQRPLQNSPKSPKFPPRHLGDFAKVSAFSLFKSYSLFRSFQK